MIYVIEAKYIADYQIFLTFSDNKSGIIDLEKTLQDDHRAIFNELLDIEKFKQFKISADTLTWKNGLDLAPEFLYKQLKS